MTFLFKFLFLSPTLNDFISYDLTTAHNVADSAQYNPSQTTVIFVHGWNQSPSSASSYQGLLNAFVNNGTFNVMALDWSQAASGVIIDFAVARTDTVSIMIESLCSYLQWSFVNLKNF